MAHPSEARSRKPRRRSMMPWYAAVIALAAVAVITTVLLVVQTDNSPPARSAKGATVTVTTSKTSTVTETVTSTVTAKNSRGSNTTQPASGALTTAGPMPVPPFTAPSGSEWMLAGPFSDGSSCDTSRKRWSGDTSGCFVYNGDAYYYGLRRIR